MSSVPVEVLPEESMQCQQVRAMFNSQGYMKFLGVRLTTIGKGFAQLEVDHHENLTQHDGFFHGGLIGALADNVGGCAAATLYDLDRHMVLAVEYKVNLLSPAVGKTLIARGRVVRPGKNICVISSEIFGVNEQGQEKLCAIAQQTVAVPLRSRPSKL
eukprot:TRINITY_DN17720_c0_g1_i3.p1 TRINITY_DN17720_c0_g1~~TRINITY_DN17720_c0_g1_i3.p1  ORF type:complete len:158 (-),score=3.19 TRINITY_DN17720_c0_g1_i3:132-605(-)